MKKQFTDTTDFFSIDSGDEILVGGKRFVVLGHERERRFGLEDPKFWVKGECFHDAKSASAPHRRSKIDEMERRKAEQKH
jgi:hypothetical protein